MSAPPDDVDVLERVAEDGEPLAREHAAWALMRLRSSTEPSTQLDPPASSG
jgi:hypothetical protein